MTMDKVLSLIAGFFRQIRRKSRMVRLGNVLRAVACIAHIRWFGASVERPLTPTTKTTMRMRMAPLTTDPQGHWAADRGEIDLFHLYAPASSNQA